jgi:predicted Zn-dependent protease
VAAARVVAKERSLAGDNDDWIFSKDIQFHIAKSTIPNAFATGGNHVYILVPALLRCQSEDELAAALAHAYAHTLIRHINHNQHALPPDAPPGAIVMRFVEHRFNLRQEQDADDLAFMVHARAGWDPLAFVALLEHLQASPARIKAIEYQLERLPPAAQEWSRPPVADGRRFQQHRDHAATIAGQRQVPQVVERLILAMPNCFLPDDLPQQKEAQRDMAAPVFTDTPNTFEKGQRERR